MAHASVPTRVGDAPLARADTPAAPAVAFLALRLNGVERDEVRVLTAGNAIALGDTDWRDLGLATDGAVPLQHAGERWWRLDALPGVTARIDEPTQTLHLDLPPAAFAARRIGLDGRANGTEPVIAQRWGGFANYDLQWERSRTGESRSSTRALLEFGAFGPPGSARLTGLARDDGPSPRVVRLDTTWTHDEPSKLASLRIGDAITRGGAWGRPLRFGGVQWATDFSTQPGYLTFPLPALRGEAALPSTADIYVNNSRRAQSSLPAGPFELADLPIVTGSGQVRVVVRDLLGREQVITQPYYASASLLRPGLHSYSYEIGAAREDYGLENFRYGKLVAAATDRLGVTDRFTREYRVETFGRGIAGGATGMWQWDPLGLVNASLVASHGRDGAGLGWQAGAERQDATWNGSVQVGGGTRRFAQAGQQADGPNRWQATVAVGGMVGSTALGLSWLDQRPWTGAHERLLSATATQAIGYAASVGAYVLHDVGRRTTTVSVGLNVVLDPRTSANLQSTRAPNQRSNSLQVQRSAQRDGDLAWSVTADDDTALRRGVAQAQWQTGWAAFNAGAAQTRFRGVTHGDATDLRLGVAGGIAWLDDSVFLSRRIEGSFAVVEVGDYADVQVLRDHHPVARTDARGRALVPGLRGYEPNRISIDPAELPFDAEVEALEVDVVPPARSGVVLTVPVKRNRSATLRLVDAEGHPVPPGSMLRIAGRPVDVPVGFEGRAFVGGLGLRTPVDVRWPGGACRAVLQLEGQDDELPDLGRVPCLAGAAR